MVIPQEFWNEFSTLLSNKLKANLNWRDCYRCNKDWTKLLRNLFEIMCKKLDPMWEFQHEYLRIDTIFYSWQEDLEKKNNKYNWDIEVAIEYENNWNDWYDEFTKISHVNSGLKVIVSYFNHKDFNYPEQALEGYLNGPPKELYKKRKYKSEKENWLFIFGPVDSQKNIDFLAFSFDGMKFSHIPNKIQIIP